MDSSYKTIIGKDVIDSLTLSMYENPLFIFREYIQNSADQIDLANQENLFDNGDGQIEITINTVSRIITIEDNATGISDKETEMVLKNIAQSTKDRAKNKGFRGIGRLGGLAYCKRLIFETSYQGEKTKTKLEWDSDLLKKIINDRSKKEQASEVIEKVTNFEISEENSEKHYFKVSLFDVENDDLLDIEEVRNYLSMVAPVPYQRHFIFKDKIHQKLKEENVHIDEYNIYVNTDKIEKLYTTSIYEGENHQKRKIDEIYDLEFFHVLVNEKKLAIGWYGISSFMKQIPSVNLARGLRLRKGNIQIGTNDTVIKFFKEQRGNNYFFGEIFALDPMLIPNARRDYFIENDVLKHFEKELKSVIEQPTHKLYYFASNIRSANKKLEKLNNFQEEYIEKSDKIGFTNKIEKKEYDEKLERLSEEAEKAENELRKLKDKTNQDTDPRNKIYEKLTSNTPNSRTSKTNNSKSRKIKYATDELSKLNNKERKLLSKVFAVIDNVLVPDLGNNLKEKIKEEFK